MSGFADILGQDRAVRVLRQALRSDKVAHAYLFAGPPGVGKLGAARTFAAALNCQQQADDACGVCSSCHKLAQGNHPDYVEVVKAEDKNNILIEQVREMIRQTQYRPYEGRYKVFVINQAEQMTTEAANALLKTLEEPRAQTVFVLVTHAPYQLPPTVVSRCQLLRFGPVPEGLLYAWAKEHLGLAEQDARLIAALADGNLSQASSLQLDYLKETRLELFRQLAEADSESPVQALAFSAKLREGNVDLFETIELLAGFVRDAVVWQVSGDELRLRNRDALPLIRVFAGKYPRQSLLAKLSSLVYARRLVERNVNKAAITDGLCLDLIAAEPTAFAEGRLPR